MIQQATFILFATAFQLIASQEAPPPPPFPPNVPAECRRPPEGVQKPHECCKIPEFFKDADFQECGFKKLDEHQPHERRGPPDCSKQLCMLKKYKLVKDDEQIDYDAMKKFMDTWAEANSDFKDSVKAAKERCIGQNQLPGPPHVCEANKIVFCVSSTMIEMCPKWEETEGCQKLKSHIATCSPFFHPKN